MNILINFIKKAINDKNYINFSYENKVYKKVQAFKIVEDKTLHSNKGTFELSKVKKLTILKEKF